MAALTAMLRPCPACSRHVRVSERACPFCAGELDATFRSVPSPRVPAVGRLSRAALFALGASGLAASACSGGPSTSSAPTYGTSPCLPPICADTDGATGYPFEGAPDGAAQESEEAGTDGASPCVPLLGLPADAGGGPCGPEGKCIAAVACEGPAPAGGASCSNLWVCVFSPESGCHASNGVLVCDSDAATAADAGSAPEVGSPVDASAGDGGATTDAAQEACVMVCAAYGIGPGSDCFCE
jgi:hypothetical protein